MLALLVAVNYFNFIANGFTISFFKTFLLPQQNADILEEQSFSSIYTPTIVEYKRFIQRID